ncbi:MAG: YraN family protein [Elusimicrobia bacterium]|nr:YraN family protein [Elusimicrobiota bacterium]
MSPLDGLAAEARAATYLEGRGFTILERRYRTVAGELDLVARDRGEIVFVEVKARSSSSFGGPEAAVDFRKQRRLTRAAESYLALHGLSDAPARFDVVAVTPEGIRHLADAFRP